MKLLYGADSDAHQNIIQLYKECGFINLINIEEKYLDYPDKDLQKASIVLAEGFLETCPDIKNQYRNYVYIHLNM